MVPAEDIVEVVLFGSELHSEDAAAVNSCDDDDDAADGASDACNLSS